jgi:hypothetical protein
MIEIFLVQLIAVLILVKVIRGIWAYLAVLI